MGGHGWGEGNDGEGMDGGRSMLGRYGWRERYDGEDMDGGRGMMGDGLREEYGGRVWMEGGI